MTDLSGQKQFTKNAVVSWAMHILVVIAGFVVPRQIDRTLGAESLGIWDLGWATVQYLSVTSMGVGGALNRYIGYYRASGDTLSLTKIATAAYVWQHFIAIVVVLISAAIALSIPYWSSIDNHDNLIKAQIVVFLLGFSLAIKMSFDYAGGIITGHHMWWIHNSLFAVQDFFLALFFILALFLGGDLYSLALIVVALTFIIGLVRVWIIKKYCSEVVIDLKTYELSSSLELLKYGAKNILGSLSPIVIFQSSAMILMAFVSPIALAIFNRHMALVRHLNTLMWKVGAMFVPMTSSLIGMNEREKAKEMLLKVSFLSMCIMLPPMVVLFVFGDLVIYLWMGHDYSNKLLIEILSLGAVVPIGTVGTVSVLAGFNAHGKISIFNLMISCATLVLMSAIFTVYGWSVITVATTAAAAWTAGNLIPIPYFLKKYFKISVIDYFQTAFLKPILVNLPIIITLPISRTLYDNGLYLQAIGTALIGLLFGGASLWRQVAPAYKGESNAQ